MPTLTVSVTNQASYSANICLYQVYDQLRNPRQLTYIWLSVPSVPLAGTVEFSWDTHLAFWRSSHPIDFADKRMSIRNIQMSEAMLPQRSEIILSRETSGGYLFSNPYPGKVPESYTILMDSSIRTEGENPVLVGLAQNGYPVTSVEAHPNTRVSFQKQARIYMTYGFMNTGELIDPQQHMEYSVLLDFQIHPQLHVTLSEKNQFYVSSNAVSKS